MQEKLIILRKTENVTQKELANIIGISVKQYSYKELGKSIFNGDEMFKIAHYFNRKVDDIFLPSHHQFGDNKRKKENKKAENIQALNKD